jgi:hypothetical protein
MPEEIVFQAKASVTASGFSRRSLSSSLAREIEYRQRRRSLTEIRLARMLAVSQGHYANAIRGHDPLLACAVDLL